MPLILIHTFLTRKWFKLFCGGAAKVSGSSFGQYHVSLGSNGEGMEGSRILAGDRLVWSPGPVDHRKKGLAFKLRDFTSSFRPEGIWGLYFRKLVNKPT